jgi:hypothetical protein
MKDIENESLIQESQQLVKSKSLKKESIRKTEIKNNFVF